MAHYRTIPPQNIKSIGERNVPYKVKGKVVWHKKGGKWSVKQRCRSHRAAVGAVKLLHSKGYGTESER